MDTATLHSLVSEFLNAHRKMVLALCTKEGAPTTSLMLYAVDDSFTVYFGTRKSFSKYKELLERPTVSLSVIHEKIDPLKVVEIRGKAVEIPAEKTADALAFFESKNPSKQYVRGADDFVMFSIAPHFIRWLDATSGDLEMHVVPIPSGGGYNSLT